MRLDDRSADGEPEPETIGLGREEGVEEALRGSRIEPDARVRDPDERKVGPAAHREDFEALVHGPASSSSSRACVQRLDLATPAEVESCLPPPRDLAVQLCTHDHPVALKFACSEREDFVGEIVNVDCRRLRPGLARQFAKTSNSSPRRGMQSAPSWRAHSALLPEPAFRGRANAGRRARWRRSQ